MKYSGADLDVGYTSNFWETVNQLGNIGPGASGSGLIDQNDHLVGSLTFGRVTSDPSGYGSCPLTPPPVPNGSNGVADFTALAAVWNSTADSTSSTGGTTLKSVLDPADTGLQVVPGEPAAIVTLTNGGVDTASDGVLIGLTWSALNATGCTASGGQPGDDWSGTLGAAGSQTLTESTTGVTTYGLTCTYPGGRTAGASVTVDWVGSNPVVLLTPSQYVAWAGTPVALSWTSNVSPCAISGGNVSLSNLAADGTTTISQPAAADVAYAITAVLQTILGAIQPS